MKLGSDDLTRRKVLASAPSVVATGALFSGSATGKRANKGRSKSGSKGLTIKNLTDAVTIANGKAKVKGWARSPTRGEVSVTTENGESATYGAHEFARDINRGVERGFWTVNDRAGELTFDLTDKGRQLISDDQTAPIGIFGCDGKNRVEGDTIYFDSDSVDDLVLGLAGAGGIFSFAGVVAGAVAGLTLGPVAFAAAGILLGLGGTALSLMNDGCGIKVDTSTNTVSSQECNC